MAMITGKRSSCDLKMDDWVEISRKRRNMRFSTALDADFLMKRIRTHNTDANKTILNLNDHCLLLIFENLNEIDVCHVQNVCGRFVPLAETAFRNIRRRSAWKNIFELCCFQSDIRRIVYKFGHLLESCHISRSEFCRNDMVQQLTGVTSLTFKNVHIKTRLIDIIHSAEHLKELVMDCNLFTVSGRKSLKSARVLLEKKSSLEYLVFKRAVPPLRSFTEFLQHNQQLVCLGLSADIPKAYVPVILDYADQIREIRFYLQRDHMGNPMLDLLCRLQNVRHLYIKCRDSNASGRSIVATVKHFLPNLTHLQLNGVIFDTSAMEVISQMMDLQHVELTGVFECSGTELVSLVLLLPFLEHLKLSFRCSGTNPNRDVNFNTIRDMVAYGNQLNFIELESVTNLRIDEQSYANLLDLLERGGRKQRLAINIKGCRLSTTFDVPVRVKRTGDRYLRINSLRARCRDFCPCWLREQ